jgi:hypothetical protein
MGRPVSQGDGEMPRHAHHSSAGPGGGSSDVSFAPSFPAGVRVDVADGAGLRFEGRLHGVGANFRGVYSELSAGLAIAW